MTLNQAKALARIEAWAKAHETEYADDDDWSVGYHAGIESSAADILRIIHETSLEDQ